MMMMVMTTTKELGSVTPTAKTLAITRDGFISFQRAQSQMCSGGMFGRNAPPKHTSQKPTSHSEQFCPTRSLQAPTTLSIQTWKRPIVT